MSNDHEHERGRHVLPRRRPRPDEPTPDDPRPVSRRRVGRNFFELIAAWFALAREVPVVFRLLLWGVVLLLAELIFRTLRSRRR